MAEKLYRKRDKLKPIVHSDNFVEVQQLVERDYKSELCLTKSQFITSKGLHVGVCIFGPYSVDVVDEGHYEVFVVGEEREDRLVLIPVSLGGLHGLFSASKLALLLIRSLIRKYKGELLDLDGDPVLEDWLPGDL